jgi:hypothetical protein
VGSPERRDRVHDGRGRGDQEAARLAYRAALPFVQAADVVLPLPLPIRRETMERVMIVARLNEGAERKAAELIASGPPFDPKESGFLRHSVYLSAHEIAFVFEGHEVEWLVDSLVGDPFNWMVSQALEAWRPLIREHPRVARERFFWEAKELAPAR